jgi:hypothetical protein
LIKPLNLSQDLTPNLLEIGGEINPKIHPQNSSKEQEEVKDPST